MFLMLPPVGRAGSSKRPSEKEFAGVLRAAWRSTVNVGALIEMSERANMPLDGCQLDGETHAAVTSAVKWARGLSVHGSVGLLTCGDRSLTRRADRDVTDARLSA